MALSVAAMEADSESDESAMELLDMELLATQVERAIIAAVQVDATNDDPLTSLHKLCEELARRARTIERLKREVAHRERDISNLTRENANLELRHGSQGAPAVGHAVPVRLRGRGVGS